MNKKMKKSRNALITILLFTALSFTLFSTTASAELHDEDEHSSTLKCTLVIDKAKNNITNKYIKGKAFTYAYPNDPTCKKNSHNEVRGYYFADKWDSYGIFDSLYTLEVKYSGEKTFIPAERVSDKGYILTTYITDSSLNTKGKTMHVVASQSLRSQAKTDSKKRVKVYQDNTIVQVNKLSGSWAYVYAKDSKSYGWMPRKYLISELTVNRIVEKVVKPPVKYSYTNKLKRGETKVKTKGKNGLETYIYKDHFKNGKKISSKLYRKYVDIEAQTKYIKRGL